MDPNLLHTVVQIICSCWVTRQAHWLPGLVQKYFYTPSLFRDSLKAGPSQRCVWQFACVCILKPRVKCFQPALWFQGAWQGNRCNVVFWWALCWELAKPCKSPQTLQTDPFHWTHANVSPFKIWEIFFNDSYKYQELHKMCRRVWEGADRL